jgi:hypothetical protein
MSHISCTEFRASYEVDVPEGFRIPAKTPANGSRRLEQLTLNQRVQGSSPCAPTKTINKSKLRPRRASVKRPARKTPGGSHPRLALRALGRAGPNAAIRISTNLAAV